MYRKREFCSYSLAEVATQLGARLVGHGDSPLEGICTLEDPLPRHLAFMRSTPKSSAFRFPTPQEIGGIIVPEDLSTSDYPGDLPPLLVHRNPLLAFVSAVHLFFEEESWNEGVHPTACIDPTVKIEGGVSIGAFVVVGRDAHLGHRVTLHPHVTIYPRVSLGDNVTVHAGAVIREGTRVGNDSIIQAGAIIGSEGFGYVWDPAVGHQPVPQVGSVIIEERARVGANTSIDRATVSQTRVGAGTKLDNLVQIGHNCQLGKHVLICGQVAMGGSTTLGDGVVIGGHTGIADHLTIASRVRVAGHSGVTGSLTEPGDYAGMPAIPARAWRRQVVAVQKIPELLRRLKRSNA